MSEKKERPISRVREGYQAKIDKPPGKPPTGGSNVQPPPNPGKK